ncbi:MAG: HupE/UreJ family protein [Deltaproteobacteria bacterium]|nr:HupE/UreJ family protein [Deltaproteobacteria bacterium]
MEFRPIVRNVICILIAALCITHAFAMHTAQAHPLAPSLLELQEQSPGHLLVRWKTPLLSAPGGNLFPLFPSQFKSTEIRESYREGTGLVRTWGVKCPDKSLVGQTVGVRGIAGSRADVFLKVCLADGRAFHRVLTGEKPFFTIPDRERKFEVFRSYFALGARHILTGWSHLLFLLGLVLLVRGMRPLVWTIFAFIAGHSVTFLLASIGIISFQQNLMEVVIGSGILVLALELTKRKQEPASFIRRFPWIMSFGFGLFHGLGFAAALSEVGLPQLDILTALVSFNIGIDLGQLAFILSILLVRIVSRPLVSRFSLMAGRVVPYAIGSLAAFWVFESVSLWF